MANFQAPKLSEPIIRTPFTDMGASMFTEQNTPFCKNFEIKYMKCIEAYGKPLGDTKCKDFLEDFSECVTKTKQKKRITMMRNERKRLVGEGKPVYESDHLNDYY